MNEQAAMYSSPFLGDFMVALGQGLSHESIRDALDRRGWPPLGPGPKVQRNHHRVGQVLSVFWQGDVMFTARDGRGGVGLYHLAATREDSGTDRQQLHEQLAEAWADDRSVPIMRDQLVGKFCYALWEVSSERVAVVTDPFRTYSLYYVATPDLFACATDLRLLLASGILPRSVDPAALYHYLNFAYVPTPFCIASGAQKLLPGCMLQASPGRVDITPYWEPTYPEDLDGNTDTLAGALRERIVCVVTRHRPPPEPRWGTFLSGGTDSSSVAGILSRGSLATPIETYSIGFKEEGFDELKYVRVAVAHFGLESHTRQVGPAETLAALSRITEGFDEPFGNASAIPTYYCAAMAREQGVRILMAGDGGDEIFGGNERYRKDKILEWYYRLPVASKVLAKAIARSLGDMQVHVVNRFKNFVLRGSLANPDRFYTDDSFASDYFEELLTPDFRASVQRPDSLDIVRGHFRRAMASCELHRLMYLDLKMTISDGDLVKVTRASKAAGIAVVYPYLDPEIVDYTGRIPSKWKVHGLEKRYLFKLAMRTILPEAILKKKKQGFGLPISVWFREQKEFVELLHDVVLSRQALSRGYFDAGFIRKLLEHHVRGDWDHGARLYLLLMLELWHRAYIDC